MRKLFYLFPAGFLVYGAICGAYYLLQEKILFHPVKLDENYQFPFKASFTEHNLITTDNAKINTVWFKATSSNNIPKGVIVYCHGNADNIDRWGQIVEKLLPLGYDILVFDYRGFGKSTGTISEKALFADTQMVYDFAKKHYSEKQIIIYGRSLGTGLATHLATTNHAKHLILETPYYSILELSQRYAEWLPTKLILQYHIRTDLNIVKVQCPITIFHGTADEVVPYDSGIKLKQLLKSGDEFITVPNGMHGDLELYAQYQEAITKILQ
jgi:alpha-beta hydrolase superfamily lysophospholipase